MRKIGSARWLWLGALLLTVGAVLGLRALLTPPSAPSSAPAPARSAAPAPAITPGQSPARQAIAPAAPAGNSASASGAGARIGIGRLASSEEVARRDHDVQPDGQGLPPGRGTPAEGRALHQALCASCHSLPGPDNGQQPERWHIGQPVEFGNYWPYATTLWDYVERAMPYDAPGTLTSDQVYALTAYWLSANALFPEDGTLDAATLPTIRMPNADAFVSPDPRPDVP